MNAKLSTGYRKTIIFVLAGILILGLILVLFSSCTGKASDTGKVSDTKETSDTTEVTTEKKIIRIWHTETEPQSIEELEKIITDFKKINPDIEIKQEALGWNELEPRLIAAISGGDLPDLTHGQAITCASFYKKDLLRSLDDVVDSIGGNNIWEGVKKIGYFDGHYYGLAHAAGTSLLLYRKDLFEKTGLAIPETWDDFIKVLKALTVDTDGDGKIDRYGLLMPGNKLFLNIAIGELIKSNGGRLFNEKNEPTLNEKPMVELLEFYQKIYKYMPPNWTSTGYPDTFKALAEGKVAMLYQGYGRGVGYINKYAPPEIADSAHFAVMKKPHGPSATKSAVQVDAEPWMIFKNAKCSEEAAEFLKFFYKDENYIKYISSVPIHFFPITKSLRKTTAYQNIPLIKDWGQWLDVQGYYLDNDLIKPTLIVDWMDLDKLPFLMEVLDSGILSDMILDVTFKGVNPKVAAADAQGKLENFLKSRS